jgi:hypothetical protein
MSPGWKLQPRRSPSRGRLASGPDRLAICMKCECPHLVAELLIRFPFSPLHFGVPRSHHPLRMEARERKWTIIHLRLHSSPRSEFPTTIGALISVTIISTCFNLLCFYEGFSPHVDSTGISFPPNRICFHVLMESAVSSRDCLRFSVFIPGCTRKSSLSNLCILGRAKL